MNKDTDKSLSLSEKQLCSCVFVIIRGSSKWLGKLILLDDLRHYDLVITLLRRSTS